MTEGMEEPVLTLTPEEFEWLVKRMEEPPRELPRLRALFEDRRGQEEA
jgi:uncharacterized protein (DUF1778 family)